MTEGEQLSLFQPPLPLLEKEDRELGWAFFCPRCKTFVCDHRPVCRHCGQRVDWDVPKTPYAGRVRWEREPKG